MRLTHPASCINEMTLFVLRVPLRLEIMEWGSEVQNGEPDTSCYDNLMFVFDK